MNGFVLIITHKQTQAQTKTNKSEQTKANENERERKLQGVREPLEKSNKNQLKNISSLKATHTFVVNIKRKQETERE